LPTPPAKAALTQAFSSSHLPNNCTADFTSLFGKKDFDIEQFIAELPEDVVNVKTQLKGTGKKPKDSEKTTSGVTVKCIKALPESPEEVHFLVKDIGHKLGYVFVEDMPPPPPPPPSPPPPPVQYQQPTPVPVAKPEVKREREIGAQLGVRSFIPINSFSTGDSDDDDDIESGFGFGVGGVVRFPITEIVYIGSGIDISYRTLFNTDDDESMSEFALSVPVTVQVSPIPRVPLYFSGGIQVDIPFNTEFSEDDDDEDNDLGRSVLDFGIVIGVEFKIPPLPQLSVDFKSVIGLTTPSTYDSLKKSSLNQYVFGVNYFF